MNSTIFRRTVWTIAVLLFLMGCSMALFDGQIRWLFVFVLGSISVGCFWVMIVYLVRSTGDSQFLFVLGAMIAYALFGWALFRATSATRVLALPFDPLGKEQLVWIVLLISAVATPVLTWRLLRFARRPERLR